MCNKLKNTTENGNLLSFINKSLLAGALISAACCIYLQCANKIIGALLFAIGLCGVILLEANLYTGKIGYAKTLKDFVKSDGLFTMLILNCIVAFFCGHLFRVIYGQSLVFAAKMTKSPGALLIDAIICGICIYVAVEGYKKSKSVITIILPVMGFILSGAEHCIADAFYLSAYGFSAQGIISLLIIILGNSIGSLVIRALQN